MANNKEGFVQTTIEKAQDVARKIFNFAEKSNDPKKYELFQKVGIEAGNTSFFKSQSILEKGLDKWDDDVRQVAVDVNQLDLEMSGEKSFSYQDVKDIMESWADNLMTDDEKEWREGGLELSSNVRGMDRPGKQGLEFIDKNLEQIESSLNLISNRKKIDKDALDRIKEYRKIRDALYAEKMKRIETNKESSTQRKEQKSAKDNVSRLLNNLYSRTDVPENYPSRKNLERRMKNMSDTELMLLSAEIKKINSNYNHKPDEGQLAKSLNNLNNLEFDIKSAEQRQKQNDQKQIDKVRQEAGLDNEKGNKYQEIINSEQFQKKLEGDHGAYSDVMGIKIVYDVLSQMVPDQKQLGNQLDNLLGQYKQLTQESLSKHPEKDIKAHQGFAINNIIKRLPESMINNVQAQLDEKFPLKAGFDKSMFKSNIAISDFFKKMSSI